MRWWTIFCVLFLTACHSEKYPGYKQVGPKLYMKLLAFDHDRQIPDSCYVLEVDVQSEDSVLKANLTPKQKDIVPKWLQRDHEVVEKLNRYLAHMQPGDSVIFIDEQPEVQTRADSSLVTIWWESCYSKSEFTEVYIEWLQDREVREANRIRLFALEKGFSSSIVHPAVLYRVEQTGKGDLLKYGDEIAITYTGHFLNGEIFDDARHADEPFAFEIGTDGQVLKGLEYGLVGARPGEVRSVVIPSVFAFGERGSSTGIVPPFTPVLYRVSIFATDSIS